MGERFLLSSTAFFGPIVKILYLAGKLIAICELLFDYYFFGKKEWSAIVKLAKSFCIGKTAV